MLLAARYRQLSDTLAPDIHTTTKTPPTATAAPTQPSKMQKFMVAKKYGVERPEIQPEPAKVKMSGYLKKKRSKVGGWRKMWFVLQNHLLLSYPTKEEYDKGLGTFKDVLNLVPGTQIQPLGGFRFTIETTTNTIYTFRCDESKTCTDWITALLESLAIKPDPKTKESSLEKIPKFHTSLNDISEVPPKETMRTSSSCDSIYQIQNDSSNPKSAKIPIAQNTARMLERNGVPTKKMSKLQQIEEENENPKKPRNFRLHERSHSVNQSDEVFRINQMFRRSISTSVLSRPGSGSRSGGSGSQSSSPTSSPFEEPSARSKLITNELLVKQLQQHYKRIKSATATSTSSENNSLSSERKYKCKHCCVKGQHKRDLNQNNMIAADCERTLEEGVQRMSLNDKGAFDPQNKQSIQNVDGMHTNKDTSLSPRRRRRQCLNHSPFRHQQTHHGRHHHGVVDDGIEADGGMDTDNEDGDGNGVVANGDNWDAKRHTPPRFSYSSDNLNRMEPIYAVVDLKNKYAHRAKMRQLEEQMERERPKSVHVVSSDYEEVLNFSHESEEYEEDDSENIYEPINIPETIQQRQTVWKYFPKFNIETIMEMARTRKKVAPGGPVLPRGCTEQYRNHNYFYNPLVSRPCIQPPPTHNQSAFSDFRKKFGYHRKSIKNRMRRFYWKDSSTPAALTSKSSASPVTEFLVSPQGGQRNAYSDDELDSQGATISTSEASESSLKVQVEYQFEGHNTNRESTKNRNGHHKTSFVLNEIEKYRRGERHFFGSLSRLKKTRASLCLDEEHDMSRVNKKKIAALAAPKSSPCFQHELRRELSRRTSAKIEN